MFVRWQKRQLNRPKSGPRQEPPTGPEWDERGGLIMYREDETGRLAPDVTLMAVLIRSERIDGKPHPRHVAYLGSIAESQLSDLGPRSGFWDGAAAALDRLEGQVTRAERRKIEEALVARVGPRPTAREKKAAHRRLVAAMDRLKGGS